MIEAINKRINNRKLWSKRFVEDKRLDILSVAEMPNEKTTKRCQQNMTILGPCFHLSQYFLKKAVA